jgi:hypothetical protein
MYQLLQTTETIPRKIDNQLMPACASKRDVLLLANLR